MATDYTRDDFAGDVDDFILPASRAIDKTADQIQRDNEFKSIPAGDHTVMVHSFPYPPKEEYRKVILNGSPAGYRSYTVCVRYCLPDDPMATIDAYFVVPPGDPNELDAYFHGQTIDKDTNQAKGKPGFDASQFYHFLGALGFAYTPGQPLPAHALRLGNWKGRFVKMTVQGGTGTYTGKDGVERPSKSRPKLFSYQPAQVTAAGAMRTGVGAAAPQGAMRPGSPTQQPSYATPTPAPQPPAYRAAPAPSRAAAMAGTGVDDI